MHGQWRDRDTCFPRGVCTPIVCLDIACGTKSVALVCAMQGFSLATDTLRYSWLTTGIPVPVGWWVAASLADGLNVLVSVRFGAVRCGAVRFDSVRCGAVRCGAVRFGAVRCGSVRSSFRFGSVRPVRSRPVRSSVRYRYRDRDVCSSYRAR